jgi:hypothetical protein
MRHRPLHIARFLPVGLAAGLCLGPSPAAAQGDGFDWVTVGDPGNRDTLPEETPLWPDLGVGGVGYRFRITRTEVTVADHFDYVQTVSKYLPPDDRIRPYFTGPWIRYTGDRDDPRYHMLPGAENYPTSLSWRHAARFMNWLHNGKVDAEWAFADGVYDTTTFTTNSDGTFNDQLEHHPGARYWIPTMDELAKATFWDPAKDGGEGGYWRYPHSSDIAPISALPWEGGETSADLDADAPMLDVGAYPWAQSPWGLLDGSGGEVEWTESMSPTFKHRIIRGTEQYEWGPETKDRVDYWTSRSPRTTSIGFRIVTTVPTPPGFALGLSALALCVQRNRRRP